MAITVVDSNNLEAILDDAGYEPPEPRIDPTKPTEKKAEPEAKADDKGNGAKPPADAKAEADDADDVEGQDGLTPRQKREMSASMLKAVGKKHRQMKEAEEFAASLVRENAELRAKVPVQKEAIEPKREDFATDSEFVDAKIKWGVDQGIRQRDAEREELARQERVGKQMQKAKEIIHDFEEVTKANLNWPGAVASYMRTSDMFAELGYHFAKNPMELTRIANLRPEQQLVAVGKIEAILAPFGTSKTLPKAEDEGVQRASNGKTHVEPSSLDTGFSPSKARSDAPVIRPLAAGETQTEPDVRDMNVRESIQAWQKDNKLDLRRRKRH
jgi:hypothetical protein